MAAVPPASGARGAGVGSRGFEKFTDALVPMLLSFATLNDAIALMQISRRMSQRVNVRKGWPGDERLEESVCRCESLTATRAKALAVRISAETESDCPS